MRDILNHIAQRQTPVLRWQSGDLQLELNGPVCANWVYKAFGMLSELAVGPDTPVCLAARGGLHWQAVCVALAASSLDAPILSPSTAAEAEDWILVLDERDANAPEFQDLLISATDVLVHTHAPLALSASTPPDCIDFVSQLRVYPDHADLPATTRIQFGGEVVTVPPVPDVDTHGELRWTQLPTHATEWAQMLAALTTGMLVLDQPELSD